MAVIKLHDQLLIIICINLSLHVIFILGSLDLDLLRDVRRVIKLEKFVDLQLNQCILCGHDDTSINIRKVPPHIVPVPLPDLFSLTLKGFLKLVRNRSVPSLEVDRIIWILHGVAREDPAIVWVLQEFPRLIHQFYHLALTVFGRIVEMVLHLRPELLALDLTHLETWLDDSHQ